VDLTSRSSAPLQLIVLKSFAEADNSIRQIDHLILIAGLLAMVLGTLLMLALSEAVTRSLEELAAGVRAFRERRQRSSSSPSRHQGSAGPEHVLFQNAAEIQQTNRALLEAERAGHHRTYGQFCFARPASLSGAVYANAEFLASARLSESERVDVLADIRSAVFGRPSFWNRCSRSAEPVPRFAGLRK